MRTLHGITQQQLADYAGISAQAVLRYEQGLYEEPSDKLVSALVSLTQQTEVVEEVVESSSQIIKEYHEFRVDTQYAARRYFSMAYITNSVPLTATNGHPFKTWRTNLLNSTSRMKFCKLLAINPAVVLEYERGSRAHMPPMIRTALTNAKCPISTIDTLDLLGARYNLYIIKED